MLYLLHMRGRSVVSTEQLLEELHTLEGEFLSEVVEIPRRPSGFRPQQKAFPSIVTAQVCSAPAEIEIGLADTLSGNETFSGFFLQYATFCTPNAVLQSSSLSSVVVFAASPSWPELPKPQQ